MLDLWSKKLLMGAVTFTIEATPSDAVVTINGVSTKSLKVRIGSIVTWEVSAPGYFTQSGKETITADTTKNITLVNKTQQISASSYTDRRQITSTNTYFKNYESKYTYKYSFVKGRSYTITYTFDKAVNIEFIATTSSSTQNTTYGNISNKVQDVYSWVGTTSTPTQAAGTYSRTFTATANASYIAFELQIIAGSSYPNLTGTIKIKDNS